MGKLISQPFKSFLDTPKRLTKIMNNGKMLGNRLFVLGIILGVADVIEDYVDGEDWAKAAYGLGGQIAGSFTAGFFASTIIDMGIIALGLTPVGWVVLIGSAVISGAAAYLGGESAKQLSEEIYEWTIVRLSK